MNCLRKKLHSQRGASILMALLMLLLCMMVAASVLAAAASNAGKVRSKQVEQQKYLTLSSAIRLIADELQKAEYTGAYTVYTWKENGGEENEEECFYVQQTAGSYSCDPLTDQIPLGDGLDKIFSKQFTGSGYNALSTGEADKTECTLTVKLPDGLKGYPQIGTGTYQIPGEVTVHVKLDHSTRHITLTAWLGGGTSAPADGKDTMSAELVAKVRKTAADGSAELIDGNPLTAVSPPAGKTAKNALPGEGVTVTNTPGTTATMQWKLHWIRKGAA